MGAVIAAASRGGLREGPLAAGGTSPSKSQSRARYDPSQAGHAGNYKVPAASGAVRGQWRLRHLQTLADTLGVLWSAEGD